MNNLRIHADYNIVSENSNAVILLHLMIVNVLDSVPRKIRASDSQVFEAVAARRDCKELDSTLSHPPPLPPRLLQSLFLPTSAAHSAVSFF
jgi:hypothetical protein